MYSIFFKESFFFFTDALWHMYRYKDGESGFASNEKKIGHELITVEDPWCIHGGLLYLSLCFVYVESFP